MQSVYSMTDTALGNAGMNVKPIYYGYLEKVKEIIDNIENPYLYHNRKKVVDALEKYANNNIDIVDEYSDDIRYSMYKAKFLICTGNHYEDNINFHRISNTDLEIYKDQLKKIEGMNIDDDEVYEHINEFLDNDKNSDNKAMKHFVTHAQDYLVQQGTLQAKQPNTVAIADKVSHVIGIKNTEPAQTLTNAQKDVDTGATTHAVLHTNTEATGTDVDTGATTHAVLHTNTEATGTDVDTGATTHAVLHTNTEATVAHAVDTSITDTPITSAGTKNDLYNKFNKYMSMLKLTEYKIPIAILSTVLGIGTIGGAYYATGSTDALDTIGSDTDTEVLNDTNDTAQRHGVCIATITACTVLLALCTTTAYWIVCKQVQPDSAYTAISMMQQTNI